MKSINYIFISLFIIITLCSGMFLRPEKTRILTLQATGKEASSTDLKQSADIISARMKLYGIKSFNVKIAQETGQLKIQIPVTSGIQEIENLITSKGELAFYATYIQEEIALKLNPDNLLFKLLSPLKDSKPYDPRIGCTIPENKKKAQDYLESAPVISNCKLAWQSELNKQESCLFALKTDEKGNPLISRSDIESVKITDSNEGAKIMIKLKPSMAQIFADATRANLNRSIAIVIDDMVYSWPLVRAVIEKGEIEVTGSFTKDEVKYFPVIFNTGQLPLNFKLIE